MRLLYRWPFSLGCDHPKMKDNYQLRHYHPKALLQKRTYPLAFFTLSDIIIIIGRTVYKCLIWGGGGGKSTQDVRIILGFGGAMTLTSFNSQTNIINLPIKLHDTE